MNRFVLLLFAGTTLLVLTGCISAETKRDIDGVAEPIKDVVGVIGAVVPPAKPIAAGIILVVNTIQMLASLFVREEK